MMLIFRVKASIKRLNLNRKIAVAALGCITVILMLYGGGIYGIFLSYKPLDCNLMDISSFSPDKQFSANCVLSHITFLTGSLVIAWAIVFSLEFVSYFIIKSKLNNEQEQWRYFKMIILMMLFSLQMCYVWFRGYF